ncbi:site-2 protease family protein [Nisaea nitritireducens]|uniref:site-2 protease family protein n=1 Tax=Nisaea nitritireducens TaxID=568392 RepID=UPI001868F2D2|nr:site-2 protease family protein [Nisaea nitritireducens]
MEDLISNVLFTASVWALPVLIAITMHEAAHGYVANMLGDPTARLMGRVTLNPFAHIDRFGTIILPMLCLISGWALAGTPFVFGYAKPVPVAMSRLNNPRRDMMLVAAAGPAINIVLAFLAAAMLHTVSWFPEWFAAWWQATLINGILLNLVLAVFNLLPIPPLDGGRIVTGLLPYQLAVRYARLERYGLFIVIGLMFLLPFIGREIGIDLGYAMRLVMFGVKNLLHFILMLTGQL